MSIIGNYRKLLPLLVVVVACVTTFGGTASAVTGADFNNAHIIDDSTYFGLQMSTIDIQNFLNSKVPTCDTNGTQGPYAGYSTRADWSRAQGVPPPFICLKDYSQSFSSTTADSYCGAITGGTKSAADIIFDVSQACGVSPQELLVLLQKEQSLVTDDWPWPSEFQHATGYGCPDSAACNSQYYGFFNQVYNAAHQTKRYVQQPNMFNYAAGGTSFVQYNPNTSCGGSNITIQNQATAALYNYTPYQPNAAALANVYGNGDSCSSNGNRNFWRLFNDWFGPTSGNGFARVISDDTSDPRQWVLYGNIKQYIPDSQTINAWGLGNTPLITMSASYLNSIATGPNLERLMRANTPGSLLYFVDNGKRYAITDNNLLNTWGIGGMVTSYVSRDLFDVPADGGYLSYDVKDPNSSTVYMTDGVTNGQRVIRPFASDAAFRAWEGDTAFYTAVSSDFFSMMNSAIGTTLSSTKMLYNGAEYQVVNGSRYAQPSPYTYLYPSSSQAVSTETFNRLANAGQISNFVRANGDPTVYMIDNGQKHAVASPTVLQAWQLPGSNVSMVDANYVSLIPTGSALTQFTADNSGSLYLMNGATEPVPAAVSTAYRQAIPPFSVTSYTYSLYPQRTVALTGFIKGLNSPQLYFLDNSGQKRYIDRSDKASLLGAYANGSPTELSDIVVSAIPSGPTMDNYVSDGTTEYLIENGSIHPISGSVKTDWGLSGPQVYSDGTLSRFTLGSNMDSQVKDGNSYFLIKGGRAFVTTDINIAQAWGIQNAQQMNQQVVTSRLYYYMLTRFVQPTDPTDTRKFIVDNGQWYNVSPAQFANLGGNGAPIMGLNANSAPNTITDWNSFVVQDSSGKQYVIDGGTKRGFTSPIIQNWWTNNGAITVPMMTNGFLDLLPTSGTVERAIKGSGPSIYSAKGETKQHILYPSTYNQYYAPYSVVSDWLINALPTGSDL